jgi:8-oxo-dGTP diphosphatase
VSEAVIRAAGGVVVRDDLGDREVVVVHRPKYDDWTLPKGKALPGESDEDCALREVEEETGLRCRREIELASASYDDAAGRPKVARYWLMRPVGGDLQPSREIDDARWVPLPEAELLLTYERDREVLRSLAGS